MPLDAVGSRREGRGQMGGCHCPAGDGQGGRTGGCTGHRRETPCVGGVRALLRDGRALVLQVATSQTTAADRSVTNTNRKIMQTFMAPLRSGPRVQGPRPIPSPWVSHGAAWTTGGWGGGAMEVKRDGPVDASGMTHWLEFCGDNPLNGGSGR